MVLSYFEEGATVSPDELDFYGLLIGDGYKHDRVKDDQKEYAQYHYRSGGIFQLNIV